MGEAAVAIVLSAAERRELESLARAHKTGQAMARRAQIVLAAAVLRDPPQLPDPRRRGSGLSEFPCAGHDEGTEGTPRMARRKAPVIPDDLLDQLLAGRDPQAALGRDGLADEMQKALDGYPGALQHRAATPGAQHERPHPTPGLRRRAATRGDRYQASTPRPLNQPAREERHLPSLLRNCTIKSVTVHALINMRLYIYAQSAMQPFDIHGSHSLPRSLLRISMASILEGNKLHIASQQSAQHYTLCKRDDFVRCSMSNQARRIYPTRRQVSIRGQCRSKNLKIIAINLRISNSRPPPKLVSTHLVCVRFGQVPGWRFQYNRV